MPAAIQKFWFEKTVVTSRELTEVLETGIEEVFSEVRI